MSTLPHSTNSPLRGHLAAFSAMALFGIISPCGARLLADGVMDGVMLANIRLIGTALCFLLILPFLPRQRMQGKDILRLCLMSLCGMAASNYSYTIGLGLTVPSHAGVMATTPPMFVLILSVIFLKQRMDWMRGLGIVIATIGVLILVFANASGGDAGQSSMLGDGLCLLAQVLLACYFVFFTDLLQRYHPFVLLAWLFTLSSLMSLPFVGADMLSFSWSAMTSFHWTYAAIIVVGTTFIPYILITQAQRLLQPTMVACYNYVQPLVALALSLLWGLEVMTMPKYVALPLIVLGLLIVTQLIRFKRAT